MPSRSNLGRVDIQQKAIHKLVTAWQEANTVLLSILVKIDSTNSVFQEEIEEYSKSIISNDQFAYKKGSNTTAALINCQYHWLKWLDEDADFIRVLSFDFSKAFDSVPHNVVTKKLKQTNLNPYIINWIISFLTNRKQRVVVDGFITEYANINRGVPQGTVIGPFLFSLMVEDIKLKDYYYYY